MDFRKESKGEYKTERTKGSLATCFAIRTDVAADDRQILTYYSIHCKVLFATREAESALQTTCWVERNFRFHHHS